MLPPTQQEEKGRFSFSLEGLICTRRIDEEKKTKVSVLALGNFVIEV